MNQIIKWVCIGIVILGILVVVSHKDTTDVELPKDEEVGRISVSPEWENKTYDYQEAYFFRRDKTWAYVVKSSEYIPYGFKIDNRFYSVTEDCENADLGYEEEYHYACHRNNDEQNYYIRMTHYPYGVKVPHPSTLPEENPY